MSIKTSFGKALQRVRKAAGLSQEDFGDVSSRTYISSLERGKKSPTLETLEILSQKLGVHPATLILLSYVQNFPEEKIEGVFDQVKREVQKHI